jgi:16S rRNA U516 pseudouridylate synthase RsuA-like enzyme
MKRQIRLMFLKIGYEVKRLLRTRIGGLKLATLRPGEWRVLDKREVALLEGGDKKRP